MGCSLQGSSVHGILQARIVEWLAILFSRGSSRPRDWTQVSCIGGRRFNLWATREAREALKSIPRGLRETSPHTKWRIQLGASCMVKSSFCLFLSTFPVQFSCSVMFNSLQPCGPQHTRFPCPSPTPGACSNSCPSSRWYHPTISSSVVPFSSCLQSFPASGSFPWVNSNDQLSFPWGKVRR